MTKQASFSELEYAAKKKQTRRDRFLAEIEAVTPWAELARKITPFYPSSGGRFKITVQTGQVWTTLIHSQANDRRLSPLVKIQRAQLVIFKRAPTSSIRSVRN